MPAQPDPMKRPPALKAPAGACDCHLHILEPGFPLAAYRDVRRRLGLSRAIIVQPSLFGFDTRCLLWALAELGEAARGVAVVEANVSDAELARLHAGGVRGLRFHMLPGGPLPWEALAPLAARVAPLGWHVQVQLDGRTLPDRFDLLAGLPAPVVIDHIGKFLEPVDTNHPSFQALLRLLDGGRVYVKLSAPYETSKTGAPDYRDVSTLAAALAKAVPERVLWASNWPHITPDPTRARPDEADLLDLVSAWVPDVAAQQHLLVDNPARLYGFAATPA